MRNLTILGVLASAALLSACGSKTACFAMSDEDATSKVIAEYGKLPLAEKAAPPAAEVPNNTSSGRAPRARPLPLRLPKGRRMRRSFPKRSAAAMASASSGCALAPHWRRLRSSRTSWAAKSCDRSLRV